MTLEHTISQRAKIIHASVFNDIFFPLSEPLIIKAQGWHWERISPQGRHTSESLREAIFALLRFFLSKKSPRASARRAHQSPKGTPKPEGLAYLLPMKKRITLHKLQDAIRHLREGPSNTSYGICQTEYVKRNMSNAICNTQYAIRNTS